MSTALHQIQRTVNNTHPLVCIQAEAIYTRLLYVVKELEFRQCMMYFSRFSPEEQRRMCGLTTDFGLKITPALANEKRKYVRAFNKLGWLRRRESMDCLTATYPHCSRIVEQIFTGVNPEWIDTEVAKTRWIEMFKERHHLYETMRELTQRAMPAARPMCEYDEIKWVETRTCSVCRQQVPSVDFAYSHYGLPERKCAACSARTYIAASRTREMLQQVDREENALGDTDEEIVADQAALRNTSEDGIELTGEATPVDWLAAARLARPAWGEPSPIHIVGQDALPSMPPPRARYHRSPPAPTITTVSIHHQSIDGIESVSVETRSKIDSSQTEWGTAVTPECGVCMDAKPRNSYMFCTCCGSPACATCVRGIVINAYHDVPPFGHHSRKDVVCPFCRAIYAHVGRNDDQPARIDVQYTLCAHSTVPAHILTEDLDAFHRRKRESDRGDIQAILQELE